MALPMTDAERFRLALMRGQVSPDYAQMNPYAMQNQADKDAMRFMGQGERMSPSAPMGGMESAYADGSQTAPASLLTPEAQAQYDAEQAMRGRSMDYTDQQNAVDSQRSIAQAMRSGKSPEGRTVGPLDVYVGPNWGEVVGDVAMKLGGGDLERRANIKGQEIDDARSESKFQKALEAERIRESEEAYRSSRDEAKDAQWQSSFDADEEERLRGAALDAASQEPIEFLDTDGQKRQVMPSWDEKSRKVIYLGEDQNPVDITGWERQYRSYGSGGSGGSGTTKYPTRWTNLDGDVLHTFTKGGVDYNRDTGEEMPNGWISGGNFFEEDAMTGSGRNGALKSFNKDTEQLRRVVTDYQDMLGVFNKYGFDLFAGDDPLGRFEKDDGALGDFTRMVSDASVEGAETGEMYSATRAVLNSIIRQQAGLSQTQPEIDKLDKQYGSRWLDDPAIMGEALRRLGPKLKMDIGQSVAQLDDDSLDLYRQRMGKAGVPDWTQWSVSEGLVPPEQEGAERPKNKRGSGANANKPRQFTEAEIDQMSMQELKDNDLI